MLRICEATVPVRTLCFLALTLIICTSSRDALDVLPHLRTLIYPVNVSNCKLGPGTVMTSLIEHIWTSIIEPRVRPGFHTTHHHGEQGSEYTSACQVYPDPRRGTSAILHALRSLSHPDSALEQG